MKTFKKILGYFIAAIAIPIIHVLWTLNGTFCIYGHHVDVVPFWGDVVHALALYFFLAIILGIIWLVVYLTKD